MTPSNPPARSARSKVRILETTLRDGSYTINFQFTAADTETIAGALDAAGFEFIEVGHGVGLGASKKGAGEAACTDEEYCRAAARAVKRGKYGMFCIPGLAELEDIDMAASNGMGFVRVGTDVARVEESKPFIARAKKLGLYICANFMKSYAMPPKEFAKRAALTQKFGSDLLCVVDSAGGMMPEELEGYYRAVREVSDIPLGFHGHENLGLAVANTLRAVDLGAAMVDTSLQGLGRSSGNAATELVVAALARKGVDLGFDLLELLDLGERYVKPLISRRGLESIDVVAGYSRFHSSFMGAIRKYSAKYQIDPRKLIIGVTSRDKVNAHDDLVERVAKELASTSHEGFLARYRLDQYFGDEQTLEENVAASREETRS